MQYTPKSIKKPWVLTALTLLFLGGTPVLADPAPRISVFELFTSGGCLDAPPANSIFHDLAQRSGQDIIALACHVTYFDSPYDFNRFSSNDCDQRHALYLQNATMPGDIPGMIMNGRFHMEGTHQGVINAGLQMSRAMSPIVRIPMTFDKHALIATMPNIGEEQPLDIWLISFNTGSAAAPSSQSCQNPQFANIVHSAERIFQWNGDLLTLRVDAKTLPYADGYVLLAQKQGYAQTDPDIVAAGKIMRTIGRED